jgi:hypothetical protein
MLISLIDDGKVREDKSGNLSHVSFAEPMANMDDLAEAIVNFHFAPGVFRDNKRDKEHFEGIELLCYDFDQGTPWEPFAEKFKEFKHVIAGSKNHMKDKNDGKGAIPRWHLFLGIDAPVVCPDAYKVLIRNRGQRYGLTNSDKACNDVTRYFYRHSVILSKQSKGGHIIASNGMDEWLLEQEKIHKWKYVDSMNERCRWQALSPLDTFKKTKYFQLLENGALNNVGERHTNCCRIVGAMKVCGIDRYAAESLIYQYSRTDQEQLKDFKNVVKSLYH